MTEFEYLLLMVGAPFALTTYFCVRRDNDEHFLLILAALLIVGNVLGGSPVLTTALPPPEPVKDPNGDIEIVGLFAWIYVQHFGPLKAVVAAAMGAAGGALLGAWHR